MRIKSDAQIYALILFYWYINAIHSLVVVNVAALHQVRTFCDNVRISSLQQYPGTGLATLVFEFKRMLSQSQQIDTCQ